MFVCGDNWRSIHAPPAFRTNLPPSHACLSIPAIHLSTCFYYNCQYSLLTPHRKPAVAPGRCSGSSRFLTQRTVTSGSASRASSAASSDGTPSNTTAALLDLSLSVFQNLYLSVSLSVFLNIVA